LILLAEDLNNKQFVEPSEILNKTISNFHSILYANYIISRNVVQIVVDGMETVFTEGIVVCLKTYVQQMIFKKFLRNVLVFLPTFSI